MLRYVALRLLLSVPTLWAVLTLVFVLVRIVPGDPALVILGDQASQEAIVALRQRLGLDEPIFAQYLSFLGRIAVGDLGQSLVTSRPILTEVLNVLPYTIELTFCAILIGVVIGLPLGVVAAQYRWTWIDTTARWISLAGLSFPAFISGILLLLAFAIELRIFPVIGNAPFERPWAHLVALVLPAINLGIIMIAYVARVARSGMLSALGEDYIRTARAKGVPAPAVVWFHALRNALIPVVTVIGLYFGILIGNSVLTEIVFNRPGLGKLIVLALNSRDYSMLQGLMVVYAMIVVIANLFTDLAYGAVDPRVRVR
jgi:ABC-type dipeptide/oligopeptide/nickel transport system permease component